MKTRPITPTLIMAPKWRGGWRSKIRRNTSPFAKYRGLDNRDLKLLGISEAWLKDQRRKRQNAQRAAWGRRNRDKLREYERKYRRRRHKQFLEVRRKYRAKNRARMVEYRRKHYVKYRAEIMRKNHAYYLRNKTWIRKRQRGYYWRMKQTA